MCCDSDNVLFIDITFNLCLSWVTDCCYNNHRLTTNEGKHWIFLGPEIVHFEKDAFLFSCFTSEMLIHQPVISNLKTIGTSNQQFKATVMHFPFSAEWQKKAKGTQTQRWYSSHRYNISWYLWPSIQHRDRIRVWRLKRC